MSALTRDNVQFIESGGKPAFAVIPYEQYLQLVSDSESSDEALIPHAVVGLVIEGDMNLVKAWRKHLGLTQADVAGHAGISQAALSQMERKDNAHRNATLEKLAAAMEISVNQLMD